MKYDIIIIGAGPGGYEMAAEAARRDLSVAIIERDNVGGTCLNRGCIPTKALCRNAEVMDLLRQSSEFGISASNVTIDYATVVARKDQVVQQLREGVSGLLNQPGITLVQGEGVLRDAHTVTVGDLLLEGSNIVIATGSAPKALPIAGAELAMNSDQILSMTTLPRSLCIVGGGVIGMEFAHVFSSFGVQVTVVEFMKEILPPFDKDVGKRLRQTLGKRGLNIHTNSAVKSISPSAGGFTVAWECKGKEQSVEAEKVLMAVGRRPVLPQGLEAARVAVGRCGIEVDDNMQTSVKGIYAIGDVNGHCMLAHAATAQGMRALDAIQGLDSHTRLNIVPSAVFTRPELAMVGLTEEQCREQGLDVVCKKGFFRSNGKALAMGEIDGLIKMIVDRASRHIVGCHIMGAHAADLIQEVVTAINADATVDLLATSIHTHPTLSEVVLNVARQF